MENDKPNTASFNRCRLKHSRRGRALDTLKSYPLYAATTASETSVRYICRTCSRVSLFCAAAASGISEAAVQGDAPSSSTGLMRLNLPSNQLCCGARWRPIPSCIRSDHRESSRPRCRGGFQGACCTPQSSISKTNLRIATSQPSAWPPSPGGY